MTTQYMTTVRDMMNTLTFGVEIETAGLSTVTLAEKLHEVLAPQGLTVGTHFVGGYYGKTELVLADGRVFTCVTDGSIRGTGAELVSPIMKGEADMEMLQTIVRALRTIGVKSSADYGCGIHVHVGVGHLDGAGLARVVATASKYDGFIRKAVNIASSRSSWCKPIEQARVNSLVRATTKEQIALAWYGANSADRVRYHAANHYDASRYYGLNLHSVFYNDRGTAEFRYFDGTLHAGLVRSYVALALGIIAKSIVCKQASLTAPVVTNKAQAQSALRRIGLVGKDMKNVREHLSKNFPDAQPRRRAAAPVADLAA